MELEITKEEFQVLYFKFGKPKNGWTKKYWDQFYENENDSKYFFREPTTADETRMFIISGNGVHRMVFLTENAEESFFDFPGD